MTAFEVLGLIMLFRLLEIVVLTALRLLMTEGRR